MRILTIVHTRWCDTLGAARVQFELSQEWQRQGHECEKFSLEDAWVNLGRRRALDDVNFSEQAQHYVRRNAGRFDIIEAHQTNLPCSKGSFGFGGLLVARSVGLNAFYEAILPPLERSYLFSRWSHRVMRRGLLRLVKRVRCGRDADLLGPLVERSFQCCDLINVCNRDEYQYVSDTLGLGDKTVCLPFGLPEPLRAAFRAAALSPAERLARREVAFIGYWQVRKGARDWGRILRALRRLSPTARFLFLGTGVDRSYVLRDLGLRDVSWVRVVPTYATKELPALLASATVGAFPSYVEGYPFGVLEKLTAGLPVIAYDAPGAREMIPAQQLVPPGDVKRMADKIAGVLDLDVPAYTRLRHCAQEAVRPLSWEMIARQTMELYTRALNGLRDESLNQRATSAP